MAHVSNISKALAAAASAAQSRDLPSHVAVAAATTVDKPSAGALFTPPNSTSPHCHAHPPPPSVITPPPMNIAQETEMQAAEQLSDQGDVEPANPPPGLPLSKGALSGLDASAAITPSLLAKEYLPGIILGNGPRPIRYLMGELTHSVPGFSRIAPAKARRLVVAALESRNGGGPDGSVAFFKTGWGRWDAHVIRSTKDSGIGSFHDGHLSPPRSEHSYALSHNDSAVHLPRHRMPAGYRDQRSGGSWTASSLREEDEDMDMVEHEADKMSLDGVSMDESSSGTDDATDDEDDWAAAGPDALRKASLPTPGAPRWQYKAFPVSARRLSRDWNERPFDKSRWQTPAIPSRSVPPGDQFPNPLYGGIGPATATPEENAAVAALLSLGASM